jgi:hypothetical protein
MYCQRCGKLIEPHTNEPHSDVCSHCGQSPWLGGGPSPAAGTDLGYDSALRMLVPVGRSMWAIAAGYAGLFALVIFPAPLALILGIVAVRHLKRNPTLHGMGRAVFGLVMGALGTAVLLLFALASIFGR